MSIQELAEEYCKSTLVGSTYIKSHAYIQGAKDVLKELLMTLSVSEDCHLKNNLQKLISELKGNLEFENEIINDNLNLS